MIRLLTEVPKSELAEILELSGQFSDLQHKVKNGADSLDYKELLKAKAESVWVEMKEKEAILLGYGSMAAWGEADKAARALGFSGHQHQLSVEKNGVTK